MKLISLGGVGGCSLAQTMRRLKQPAYPFDWIISTQSFVIDSIVDKNNFLIFDEKFIYDKPHILIEKTKRAISLHDFTNLNSQKKGVIDKYTRRFERMYNSFTEETVLFVRIMDVYNPEIIPGGWVLPDIFIQENESIDLWKTFLENISKKYNKQFYLLLIDIYNLNLVSDCPFIIIKKHNCDTYDSVITETINDLKNHEFVKE
jgi:hypothetical protein